jgi:hypothetical protein
MEKSLFYEEKSLVGWTPGKISFFTQSESKGHKNRIFISSQLGRIIIESIVFAFDNPLQSPSERLKVLMI